MERYYLKSLILKRSYKIKIKLWQPLYNEECSLKSSIYEGVYKTPLHKIL